jgi:hypothetical protein
LILSDLRAISVPNCRQLTPVLKRYVYYIDIITESFCSPFCPAGLRRASK